MHPPRLCSRCSTSNPPENAYCAQCGAPLQSAQTPSPEWRPPVMSNSVKTMLIAGGILVGMCALCGIFGGVMEKLNPRPANSNAALVNSTPAVPTPLPTPEWTAAERLAKAKDMFDDGKGAASREDLNIIAGHLRAIPQDAPEAKQAKALLPKVEAKLAKIASDEALLGPKPENSGWDGSVRCVDQYLKQTLNDYDSAEYVEWSPVIRMDTKEGPYWAVRLKLRATNAFGGKILKEVLFFIRQNRVVKHTDL